LQAWEFLFSRKFKAKKIAWLQTFGAKSWRSSKKHFSSASHGTLELEAWELHERPNKNIWSLTFYETFEYEA
jgi:hypothetical protein